MPKRRGCVRMTYELIASLIHMDGSKILFAEANNENGTFHIYHQDESYDCYDVAECGVCPVKNPNLYRKEDNED